MSIHAARQILLAALLLPLSANAVANQLSLEAAVDRALASNPSLSSLQFDERALAAESRQAGLIPNPELTISAEDAFGTGQRQALDDLQTTLSLSQVLERGLRVRRVAVADARYDAFGTEQRAVRLDVAAETARRFVEVLGLQAKLALANEAVGLAEAAESAANDRVRSAKAPDAEVLRARADLARARLVAEDAEHELLTSRRRLSAQWGETGMVDALEAAGDLLALPDTAPLDQLEQRVGENPDLLRFNSLQDIRLAELRLQQQRTKPSWTVSAGVRHFARSDDVAGVASLTIPLSFRDRNSGNIAASEARVSQVETDRNAANVQIRTQLFAWLQELRHAHHVVETLQASVIPDSQRALEATRRAYQRGRYGYRELQLARSDVLAAREQLIEAATNAHRFAIEIDRLVGGSQGLLNPAQTAQ